MTTHKGGCHCGKVRFEVEAPPDLLVSECNCSICSMVGYQHLTVSKSDFKLLQGEDQLSTYEFDTKVAQHYFCKHCGIKSFYVPRSHPEGISVNVRCVEPDTINSTTVEPFDGRNWEQNVYKLAPLRN